MNAASQLGKMAKGVPKKFSPAEIAKRTARLRKAQKNRAKAQRALRRSSGQSQKEKCVSRAGNRNPDANCSHHQTTHNRQCSCPRSAAAI